MRLFCASTHHTPVATVCIVGRLGVADGDRHLDARPG